MSNKDLKYTVDRVSDIIDEALRSNDYSNLSRDLGKIIGEATSEAAKKASSVARNSQNYGKQGYGGKYQGYGGKGQSGKGSGKGSGKSQNYGRTYQRGGSNNGSVGGFGSNPYPQGYQVRHGEGMTPAQRLRYENQERRVAEEQKRLKKKEREAYESQYFAKPSSASGAGVMNVFGIIIAVMFGLISLMFALYGIFGGGGGAAAAFTIFNAVVMGLGLMLMLKGRKAARRSKRFKTYRTLLMPKLYMDVRELSREAQVPEDEVIRDLTEFSNEKLIKQGHFDEEKKTFIASDEIYEQYLETAKQAKALRAEREAKEKANAAYSPEVQELLEKGNACVQMIHKANDDIPDPVVTEKLSRMENIVARIFSEVRKRPQLAGGLNMFMNYYLPTTTKLIDAYREMDQQPVQGENIRVAKREIEASLDTINDAFEKLLDSFFKETAMDVSSDINVMKMMMKQDGLAPDDLTAMQQRQEQINQRKMQQNASTRPQPSADSAQGQGAGVTQSQGAGAGQAAADPFAAVSQAKPQAQPAADPFAQAVAQPKPAQQPAADPFAQAVAQPKPAQQPTADPFAQAVAQPKPAQQPAADPFAQAVAQPKPAQQPAADPFAAVSQPAQQQTAQAADPFSGVGQAAQAQSAQASSSYATSAQQFEQFVQQAGAKAAAQAHQSAQAVEAYGGQAQAVEAYGGQAQAAQMMQQE